MEFTAICKRMDESAGPFIGAMVRDSSISDMIQMVQIMPFFLIERMWAFPHVCIYVAIICDDTCLPLFKGCRDNVTFLDILWKDEYSIEDGDSVPRMGMFRMSSFVSFNAFILSCDWCSFVNGTLYTVVQNIESDPELLVLFEPYIELIHQYCQELPLGFNVEIEQTNIPNVPAEYLERYTPVLNFIGLFRSSLDEIETRWCPFKRAKSTYFRNTDRRFQSLEPNVVRQVGEILATRPNITCDECPRIINGVDTFDHDPDRISLIQPLLDFVCR
jgi:hypothetical protein